MPKGSQISDDFRTCLQHHKTMHWNHTTSKLLNLKLSKPNSLAKNKASSQSNPTKNPTNATKMRLPHNSYTLKSWDPISNVIALIAAPQSWRNSPWNPSRHCGCSEESLACSNLKWLRCFKVNEAGFAWVHLVKLVKMVWLCSYRVFSVFSVKELKYQHLKRG